MPDLRYPHEAQRELFRCRRERLLPTLQSCVRARQLYNLSSVWRLFDTHANVSAPSNKRLEPAPPFSDGRIVFVNSRALRRGSAAGR